MARLDVVRVFCDTNGEGGNPLGIVLAGDVAEPRRQQLAAQLGYSETVFVDEPVNGMAALRIYTPTRELPFAGHPTVGTAWWLAKRRTPAHTLQVPAGRVAVTAGRGGVMTVRARPAWAPVFVLHPHDDAEELVPLDPASFTEGSHYAWAWTDQRAGRVRARMFAPDLGVAEDEATGAAAIRLTEHLRRDLVITQGQGSVLTTRWRAGWVELSGRTTRDTPPD